MRNVFIIRHHGADPVIEIVDICVIMSLNDSGR